jgi:XRE family transcriptional regulator, fatty acid utilization regulator
VSARDRFADNVRTLREQHGMTQEQLAEASGLHLNTISKLENKHREPKLTVITKVAGALDVPLGPLFDGIEP